MDYRDNHHRIAKLQLKWPSFTPPRWPKFTPPLTMMDKQRYQVVYPVLPMDLMGMYILLPEGSE